MKPGLCPQGSWLIPAALSIPAFPARAESAEVPVVEVRAELEFGGPDLLARPYGICTYPNGYLVADSRNSRLALFSESGALLDTVTSLGPGMDLNSPGAVAGRSGVVAMDDAGSQRVLVLSADFLHLVGIVHHDTFSNCLGLRNDTVVLGSSFEDLVAGGVLSEVGISSPETRRLLGTPVRGTTESSLLSLNRSFFALTEDLTVLAFQTLSRVVILRGEEEIGAFDVRTDDTPTIRQNFRAARRSDDSPPPDLIAQPTFEDLVGDIERACSDGILTSSPRPSVHAGRIACPTPAPPRAPARVPAVAMLMASRAASAETLNKASLGAPVQALGRSLKC